MKEHIEVRNLLILAAAEALNPAEQKRVEKHLQQCEECRAELDEWMRLTGALEKMPTRQAPPNLALKTRRLLERQAAAEKKQREMRFIPALVVFSWAALYLNWRLVQRIDAPLTRWLDISSTTLWMAYIGITWLATTVLAAGFFVQHARQERIVL
jgi:anti-sigma factor RsiW